MKTKWLIILLVFLTTQLNAQNLQWNSRGVGGGGALFAPSINPVNDNEFFVGCDMSELFRSSDFGNTYTQEHFQTIQAGHNSTMRFTSFVNIRYCIDYSDYTPQPVKSTTNGTSWNLLPGNPDPSEETYSIHVDYNQSNHIIISYYSQIYFSNDGGNIFTLIHTAANSGTGILIGGTFFDGNTIFIGTNDGLIVSSDNGNTFSIANIAGIPAGEVIFSFAGAKEGNTLRFFCLTADENDIYVGIPGSDYWGLVKGVYSLDYGSGSWISKMAGININNDFLMFVGMTQNDIDIAYLAGSNSIGEPNVMKTINAGTSWTHVFNTTNNQNIYTGWCGSGGDRGWSYAECPFGFAIAPNNANKLLFSDFGFVHLSSNGGVTWKQAYLSTADQNLMGATTPVFKSYHSNGLENTTCWNMLWSDATHVFSAFSDINGIKSDDAGVTWKMAGATTLNSTYYFLEHPTNGKLYAATSSIHDMYQTTRLTDAIIDPGDGDIMYSANNGQSWLQVHDFNHPVMWLALDPNNSNKMYASVVHYAGGVGEGGIWMTSDLQNNSSSTWTKLANPPRTEGHPFTIKVLNDGTLVCSYSGRRNAAGAFTSSSGIFKMNAGSSTWTDVSDAGMLYYTKDLVIDPYDASQNTWYACVWGGWGGPPNGFGGLYKTTNRGQSWTRIFSGADRVSSIAFSPTNQNQIWMTTETDGLWRSTNINAATPSFTQIASYPFRQPERVFYNPYNSNEMWVTSFGNGMKVTNLTLTEVEEINLTDQIEIFPNPVTDKFTVYIPITIGKFPVELKIYDVLGNEVLSEIISTANRQLPTANWQRGIYFLKVFSEGKMAVKKIVLE